MRRMRRVRRWLGNEAGPITISGALQNTAKTIREAYLEYIGKVGREIDSPAWWMGSLSEKNPAVCKAFLHVCYVVAAVDLCIQRGSPQALVLVVESRGVRRAITGCLLERGIPFIEQDEPLIHRIIDTSRDLSEMGARLVLGLVRTTGKMTLARLAGFHVCAGAGTSSASARPIVLLYNWVDARSFSADGRYRDVYFGALRNHVERRGIRVGVVATILPRTSYWGALRQLKRAGMLVLVPHASLTIGDLVRGSVGLISPKLSGRTWPRFSGFNISEILVEAIHKDRIKNRLWEVGLISSMVRRWCERLDIQTFIYPYEGHAWERAYCQAFRTHNSQVKLIGYQHATVSLMCLNHFIVQAEWGKVPFPDRVVTNSPYHFQLFLRNGMPESVLASGGAFRYDTLGENVPARPAAQPADSRIRVLLAPAVIATNAAELLLVAIEAFPGGQQFTVVLKCHPRLPADRVLAEAGCSALPDNFLTDERPIAEALRHVDVVVYSDSTVALEALAQGIPVVHYSSNHEIDLDPLEDFPDLRFSTGTAQGLRDAVCALVQSDPAARLVLVRRAREVIQTILAKPDESTVDLFVPDHPQGPTPVLSGEPR